MIRVNYFSFVFLYKTVKMQSVVGKGSGNGGRNWSMDL